MSTGKYFNASCVFVNLVLMHFNCRARKRLFNEIVTQEHCSMLKNKDNNVFMALTHRFFDIFSHDEVRVVLGLK